MPDLEKDTLRLWDGSDMNQSVLNKAQKDKFLLVLNVPPVLKGINTADERRNELISLDSLQFSCTNAKVPRQSVGKIDLGFAGQKAPVTSYARPAQEGVTFEFNVDSNFNNYHFLWTWLDNLNHCREAIPTKDYYNPKNRSPMESFGAAGALDSDEPGRMSVKKYVYEHSFFDYQTTVKLYPLREYNEPIAEFTFTNAFITDLGELDFKYSATEQLPCSFTLGFGQADFRLLAVDPSKPKMR